MESAAIVRLEDERARVNAIIQSNGDSPRAFSFIGDLLLDGEELFVAVPALGEVLVVGLSNGQIVRRMSLYEKDREIDPRDELRLTRRGTALVVALRSQQSHGGDRSVDLYVFESAVRRAFHVPQRDEPEMSWALSEDGAQLLTVEADTERRRLRATVRSTATGKRIMGFSVGDEDEIYCGAVALDEKGRRAAFAHETGVLLYDLGAKKATPVARWKRPADQTSALYFSERRGVLLGVEEAPKPRIWGLDTLVAPVSRVVPLPAGKGSRCLRISADETMSFWLGRLKGSKAWSLFRLRHDDGNCQVAGVNLGGGKEAPAVGLDASCTRLALATADGARVEVLSCAWSSVE